MHQVKASLKNSNYTTDVKIRDFNVITDEPIEIGGQNKGATPVELLCASLASCTAITLKMYIDRKEWNITSIEVEVKRTPKTNVFISNVFLTGNFDEKQQERILKIAKACPVHKMLANGNEIQTTLNIKTN